MKIFKTRFQPLCGLDLQSAVKWLTFTSPILIAIGVGLLILDIVERWSKWQDEKAFNVQDYYIRLSIWIGYFAHIIGTLIIDSIFYKCSRTKNIPQLRNCEISTTIIVTWGFIVYIYHTFKFGIHIRTLAIYNAYIAYKYYLVVIIHYFIKEIEDEIQEQSAVRNLTDEEIEAFQKGVEESSMMRPEMLALRTLQEQVVHMQYEKSLQIETDDLKLDTSCPLGAGAYGSVYKGQLHMKDGYEITVAVKTTDPEKTDVMYFKALLLELKVMARLGRHDHVVEFLGASVSEIRERKLFIAMEFCSLGSMYSFLRSSAGVFVNMVRDGIIRTANTSNYQFGMIDEGEQVTTEDLVRWSYEIASGMEFLQFKKVVHGDLAARNVLLTGRKTAKITDFGLARQLYSYSVYVKRQNTPLPWRHLALESISDMTFSSLSDVWSYAVTLWEIFTLIETPWVQHEFNVTFVEQLKQGVRLNSPQYAPTDVYELMLHCWKSEPSERPDFNRIMQFFTNNYKKVKGISGAPLPAMGNTYLASSSFSFETEV